jgi:antitoxin component of MazEF toxin-antitoxin module
MTRTLKKMGNSKGFIMTRDMIQQLGLTDDTIEVSIEKDRIVITAPKKPRQRQLFEEAKAATFNQYDEALDRLGNAG